jgi:Ca2+-binding RTX toxin-like protein
MFGGSGSDRLFGLAGNDHLFGNSGNDIVVGGDGNDRLFGDGGRDILIGGDGGDELFGESDEDILVSDITIHDENDDALRAILAEWTSGRRYIERVNNIRDGGGNNGAFTLNDTTVVDDANSDRVFGGSSLDWFLFGSGDRIRDRGRNEQIN